MAILAITQPLSHPSNRLIVISDSGNSIKLVSSKEETTFNYANFFEVNKITHIVGQDISLEDAKALIQKGYDPDWYKHTGEEYSADSIELIIEQQNGVKRELDFLSQYLQQN